MAVLFNQCKKSSSGVRRMTIVMSSYELTTIGGKRNPLKLTKDSNQTDTTVNRIQQGIAKGRLI